MSTGIRECHAQSIPAGVGHGKRQGNFKSEAHVLELDRLRFLHEYSAIAAGDLPAQFIASHSVRVNDEGCLRRLIVVEYVAWLRLLEPQLHWTFFQGHAEDMHGAGGGRQRFATTIVLHFQPTALAKKLEVEIRPDFHGSIRVLPVAKDVRSEERR